MSQNNAPGAGNSGGGPNLQNVSGSSRNLIGGRSIGGNKPPSNEGNPDRDGSSQGKRNSQNKLSPITSTTMGPNGVSRGPMGSGENPNHGGPGRPQGAAHPMTGKGQYGGQKNNVNLSNSIGCSPIVSKKSHRYEDIENLYDYIVEQEELRRLKQQKLFAKRRKQKKKQLMSQIGTGVNNSELVVGAEGNSPSQNNQSAQYPPQ